MSSAKKKVTLKKTPKQALDEAFEGVTRALAADMPVLIHGSGGGGTVDGKESAAAAVAQAHALVAALTAQYCQRLVEAAVDALDMLSGSHDHGSDGLLIPLPPPLPPPPLPSSSSRSPPDTKRKRASEQLWDDPLPRPKIRGQQQQDEPGEDGVDDWVGVAGVDLWERSRARAAYCGGVRGGGTLSAQQFVFPVCHDTYVYGRIREVQAARLTAVEPLLHDATVLEAVRTEGRLEHEEALRKRRRWRKPTHPKHKKSDKNKDSGTNSDAEDEEDPDEDEADEDEEGPTWPGLEGLLPAHRGIV